MIKRRADRRSTVLTGCQKSTHDLVLMLKLFTFIVSWRNNLIGLTLDIAGAAQRVSRKNVRGGSGLGERGKKSSSSSFLSPSSFFLPFPLRFVKLRYEKLSLSCNGRKTLVNSKYQLKRANLHLVFIGFQSNYSFFNVCNLETKTGFRKEMKKMRDVGFSWQRSGRSSRPRWLGLGVKELNVLFFKTDILFAHSFPVYGTVVLPVTTPPYHALLHSLFFWWGGKGGGGELWSQQCLHIISKQTGFISLLLFILHLF